jgi:thiamine pyrophosphate-dependent acetolactate synthase large subunit-like protein
MQPGMFAPGNLHLMNGLQGCDLSRVAVVSIVAQIPRHEIEK